MEDEGVDEEADEPLGLGAVAVGERRAHRNVFLTRVAGEQELEGSQQHHEGRGAFSLGERLHPVARLSGEDHGDDGAPVGLNGGTRPVGGQLERGRGTGELVTPPIDLGREDVTLEPLALPDGEVGVLDGQGGELGGFSPGELPVEGGELADDDGDRPSVGDDVVCGGEQEVLVITQAHQGHVDQQTPRQVE